MPRTTTRTAIASGRHTIALAAAVEDAQAGRHALIVLGTMLTVVPFIIPLIGVADAPLPRVVWVLVVLSTLANVGVMFYHWTAPAHPKFLMLPFRKFVLRVHIFSGTAELLLGIAALLTHSAVLATLTAIVALAFHVPSAFQQTTIVFGSRAIMRPAYLACVALHAFAAIQLLRFPTSVYWLAATFLIFNVYVWVRVYYFTFVLTGLFGEAKYSVSVLAAGLTTVPLMLGPTAILMIGAAVLMHYLLYRGLVLEPTSEAVADFVRERARDVAVNDDVLELWANDDASDDDASAETYFKSLDRDRDGFLDAKDLRRAFADWSIPESLARELLARKRLPERVDLATFRGEVWSLGHVREKARKFAAIDAAKSDQDRAGLVFRRIDLDGDGYISRFELELLLIEWGLPKSDADRWMRLGDSDGDGRLTRADFYERFRPVWKFIYYVVVESKDPGHDSVQRKVFGEKEDRKKSRAMRTALDANRLRDVALFAGASDAFLDDITQAMSEEQHPAGQVLFREGDAGRAFYYIASGSVRLTAYGERLAELGAGTWFGEGALLSDQARSATAEVAEDAVLYAITRDTFRFFLERHPDLHEQLKRLDRERTTSGASKAVSIQLLARVTLFEGVNGLDALGANAERRTVGPGTVLLRQGSPGDELMVIVNGSVRIVRDGETVAEVRDGAVLGEGAVLSGEPRSADAVAVTRTSLLVLKRETLLAHDGVRERLSATNAERERLGRRRLVRQERLRKVSALAAIPDERLDALADALESVFKRDGEPLFLQGDPGDHLYIVQRGTVRIERDSRVIASVGAGGCFGELALLSDGTRTASAVAEGTTELLALQKGAYWQLVSGTAA
ncbi:MAG: cyclic nucleotide-binding domain-containing protein [Gemmatimonadales bacterium]